MIDHEGYVPEDIALRIMQRIRRNLGKAVNTKYSLVTMTEATEDYNKPFILQKQKGNINPIGEYKKSIESFFENQLVKVTVIDEKRAKIEVSLLFKKLLSEGKTEHPERFEEKPENNKNFEVPSLGISEISDDLPKKVELAEGTQARGSTLMNNNSETKEEVDKTILEEKIRSFQKKLFDSDLGVNLSSFFMKNYFTDTYSVNIKFDSINKKDSFIKKIIAQRWNYNNLKLSSFNVQIFLKMEQVDEFAKNGFTDEEKTVKHYDSKKKSDATSEQNVSKEKEPKSGRGKKHLPPEEKIKRFFKNLESRHPGIEIKSTPEFTLLKDPREIEILFPNRFALETFKKKVHKNWKYNADALLIKLTLTDDDIIKYNNSSIVYEIYQNKYAKKKTNISRNLVEREKEPKNPTRKKRNKRPTPGKRIQKFFDDLKERYSGIEIKTIPEFVCLKDPREIDIMFPTESDFNYFKKKINKDWKYSDENLSVKLFLTDNQIKNFINNCAVYKSYTKNHGRKEKPDKNLIAEKQMNLSEETSIVKKPEHTSVFTIPLPKNVSAIEVSVSSNEDGIGISIKYK